MVAHALMRHGHSESAAIAIARSAIVKWGMGGSSGAGRGHVHPQVQAAAIASTIHQHLLDHQRRKTSLSNADPGTVHKVLRKGYPPHVLQWVRSASWTRRHVPLDKIHMQPRPGHPVDPAKVASMRQDIRDGKAAKPVVLVNTGKGKLKIADGYHRLKAHELEHTPTADAYVAKVTARRGPWSRSMHDAKLNA